MFESEIPQLKALHDKVYNRDYPIKYFEWVFKNPYGVIPMSMWDCDKLIGFYCGDVWSWRGLKCARLTIAMIYPDYRKRGLMVELAKATYQAITDNNCVFLYFFANRAIVNIYKNRLGFNPLQLKKYWLDVKDKKVDIDQDDFYRIYVSQSKFKNYRYLNHPTKRYTMYLDKHDLNNVIFNVYKNQLQLIQFYRLTSRLIEFAIHKAKINNCEYITCWNNELWNHDWEVEEIETWFGYRQLNSTMVSQEENLLAHLRMGMSDVY